MSKILSLIAINLSFQEKNNHIHWHWTKPAKQVTNRMSTFKNILSISDLNVEDMGSYTCQIVDEPYGTDNVTIHLAKEANSIFTNIAGVDLRFGSVIGQENSRFVDCSIGKLKCT